MGDQEDGDSSESECFTMAFDHIIEIFHLTRLPVESEKRISKVVEGRRTIWVARRTQNECIMMCYLVFQPSCRWCVDSAKCIVSHNDIRISADGDFGSFDIAFLC